MLLAFNGVPPHAMRWAQGRMTLLLGPPGSGKTTLLKALSGKLDKNDLKARAWRAAALCALESPSLL